jgi:hypothetical protein
MTPEQIAKRLEEVRTHAEIKAYNKQSLDEHTAWLTVSTKVASALHTMKKQGLI